MNEKTAVITGAGTGIGRALAQQLASQGLRVLIVGRRQQPLVDTASVDKARIEPVVADVSSPLGRRKISSAIGFGKPLHYLVHNAAQLQPVCKLEDVILSDWRNSMFTNVEAPIFLTQALLPQMSKGARILHISSGAAHRAYQGWGAYCVSKAALNMAYRCLDLELAPKGIRVGSVRPGVVDTPMQEQIRQSDDQTFPSLARFVALKEKEQLVKPVETGRFLSWLLLEVDAESFAAEEWDYREVPKEKWR